jgi:hypothetical protein
MEGQRQQIESERQKYAQATHAALENAALAQIAAIPELHYMSLDQARGALAVIQKNNPARYLEIVQLSRRSNAPDRLCTSKPRRSSNNNRPSSNAQSNKPELG